MNKTISDLIKLGEGYHAEFKESLDKTFAEEVCAFANAKGGKVFLGVTNSGDIKGIDTGNNFRSQVQDYIRQLQPSLSVDIEVEGKIIVVHVPEGSEKPYGCSRGFFMRVGPNTQKLTRNEIIGFFKKEGRIRFETLINDKADFERDFDPKAFDLFVQKAGISPTIKKEFLLRNLDCLTENNEMTNAGVLFFARDIDFLLNHATVVCALYKGNEKLHIMDKKDFKGNLMDNIENAIMFVQRHTNLEYKIEKLRREEIPEIPEIALREAIVNAVCHRDYFQQGANVMIEVFDNRVDITNPGGLPGDLKPEEFGTRSVLRNPILASLLLRIDYIEKMGTGINRIKNAVNALGKSTVGFGYTGFFTTTFNRIIPDIASGKDIAETSGKDIAETSGKKLNKTCDRIIKLIKNNPGITINRMVENLKITERSIYRNMHILQKEGVVRRIGGRK
ncbi:MAG: helix-turn-helix domain-containing protein, partial [Candidatus Delongbacteria bacterium]